MDETNISKWIEIILKIVLILSAIFYIFIYFYIVFSRIRYPFELELMEGGSLIQVMRILNGQKLYVRPSLDFTPYIYPPLYFYLSAAVARIVSDGFLPLRLVSFISSLGCFSIVYLIVQKEIGSKYGAILASSLLAACYWLGGAWFDIARVDTLFLFLLLCGIYLVRLGTCKADLLAAALFSFAFLTKQTALIVLIPIMLYIVILHRQRAALFIGTALALIIANTLFLNRVFDGWYVYYIYELPGRHRIFPPLSEIIALASKFDFYTIASLLLIQSWIVDVLRPLSIACILSLLYFLTPAASGSSKKDRFFYFMVLLGMLGVSWVSKMNPGGYKNVWLPAFAIIAILFGLGLSQALEVNSSRRIGLYPSTGAFIHLICLLQFLVLMYPFSEQIPSQGDLETGQRLVEVIQRLEGDVWMSTNSSLAIMAGKMSFTHETALCELAGCFGGREEVDIWRDEVIRELKAASQNQKFDAVILNSSKWSDFFSDHYLRPDEEFDDIFGDTFWPVTGHKVRPEYLYLPMDRDVSLEGWLR